MSNKKVINKKIKEKEKRKKMEKIIINCIKEISNSKKIYYRFWHWPDNNQHWQPRPHINWLH